jgi:hypothetical protein
MSEFYVDVRDTSAYVFYYNIEKLIRKGVNYHVKKVIGQDVEDLLTRNGRDYAKMAVFDPQNRELLDTEDRMYMQGITASVNKELAEDILKLAQFYCPVETGYLRDSGRIEENEDGSCRIYFDCPYAWYVHEFSWKLHQFPTCDHFLTRAIYEIEKERLGIWA